MVVITAAESTRLAGYELAARRAAEMLSLQHELVIEAPLSTISDATAECPVVSMPTTGELECYPPADALDALSLTLQGLADEGWTITVGVEAPAMGVAHRALRGVDVVLQPWWRDGADVSFGGPEVP